MRTYGAQSNVHVLQWNTDNSSLHKVLEDLPISYVVSRDLTCNWYTMSLNWPMATNGSRCNMYAGRIRIIIIIIVLYYRLAEHIDRYMAVAQYIVITLHRSLHKYSYCLVSRHNYDAPCTYNNRLQWELIREEYTTLEAIKALISALSGLLSLHIHLNIRLRIVDWQHNS